MPIPIVVPMTGLCILITCVGGRVEGRVGGGVEGCAIVGEEGE